MLLRVSRERAVSSSSASSAGVALLSFLAMCEPSVGEACGAGRTTPLAAGVGVQFVTSVDV